MCTSQESPNYALIQYACSRATVKLVIVGPRLSRRRSLACAKDIHARQDETVEWNTPAVSNTYHEVIYDNVLEFMTSCVIFLIYC